MKQGHPESREDATIPMVSSQAEADHEKPKAGKWRNVSSTASFQNKKLNV